MGFGDQLLASGQAKLLHRKTGQKVQIMGKHGRREWMPLYNNVPYLGKGIKLYDYGGHRAYYNKDENGRVIFNYDYKAEPATVITEAIDTDYIIIEPNIKPGAPPAKKWHYYQEVVDAFPAEYLQFNKQTLKGVDTVKTDLKLAAAYMKGARAYIGTEGFLHHLAAAVGTPAVVVIGAYSPAEVIGYDNHFNITVDDPEELGHRQRYGAMERIKPDTVIEALYDCCGRNLNKTTHGMA